jgi:subfamily B ATP-binding cassette protein MsbA
MLNNKVTLPNAWQAARELIWTHRYRLALGMSLMLVNRIVGLVLPASSKYLVDEVIGKGRTELLTTLALAAGAATLVQAVSSFALSQILGVAAQRAITDMRKEVQEHVARLPTSFFDSAQTGQLISRIMTDAEGIRNLVGTGIVQLLGGFVTATLALFVLFYLNWRLTAITLVALAIFGACLAFAFNRLRPLFRERGEINALVTGRLGETLGGIRIVKAYSAERRESLAFARGAHKLFRNIARSLTGVSAVTAFSTVVVGGIGVIMISVGGASVVSGEMTLGDLFMYIFFTALVAAPLVEIAAIGTQVSEAFAGLDRIQELKRLATEDEGDAERVPLAKMRGDVAFEDVSFEYSEGVPVLKRITFQAPAGTTTALVGSSGSGKSTLMSLVMRFNRPGSGRITVDDIDADTVRLRDYRKHIGVVLQDNFLFDGTVRDNIAFSRPAATLEEILTASRTAHCDEFVAEFADGYNTVVGERGVKLSGGQRQRIAIARAILANPRILILDEATSSLDSESESLIQDGLQKLRAGRTTFVIAHRLSTIRSANQILVLEAGEIVERGTHSELLQIDGRYKQLYDKQYNFERNQFINPGEDFTAQETKPLHQLRAPSATRPPAL